MVENEILHELKHSLAAKFRNIEPLEKGGATGKLYIADYSPELEWGKSVIKKRVIKILRPEKADDPLCAELFNKEKTILLGLDHPGLPSIHEEGQIRAYGKELPYLVMDYYEKGTILSYINSLKAGPQKFQAVKHLLFQILDVLEYLHGKNIYHLDIKNGNLLVTEIKPNSPVLKLTDFGAAESLKAGPASRTIISTKENWPEEYKDRFANDPSNPARAQIRLEKGDIGAYIDLHMLGLVFIKLFDLIVDIPKEKETELCYLRDVSERLLYKPDFKEDIIPNANIAREIIEKWNLCWEQTSFLEGGYIRIPGFGIRHFSSQIRKLVDSRLFQRLRKFRQLALVHLVFPGGTHTRFEHSLGMLESMLAYISSLCRVC